MNEIVLSENNTIAQRAERLAAAVFIVSSSMSDTEKLKTKVRDLSLEIVSFSISLMSPYHLVDGNNLFFNIEKSTTEIISLLGITSVSGLVSQMNSSILKEEFEKFLKELSLWKNSSVFASSNVSKDFFNFSNRNLSDNTVKPVEFIRDKERADFILDKEKLTRKDQRNKAIIAFISKNKDVNIKDISSSIKGCSEKTVQRELGSLIQLGLVKKTGERRWSRYALI